MTKFISTKLLHLLSALSVLIVFSQPTLAQDPSQIPTEVFAARPDVSQVSMSPNGDAIGMVMNEGERRVIMLQNLDGSGVQKIGSPKVLNLLGYQWVNNDAILIFYKLIDKKGHVAGRQTSETRLYSFHRSNAKFKQLFKPDTRSGAKIARQTNIIDYLPDDPNHVLINLRAPGSNFFNAYRLDIRNGATKTASKVMKHMQRFYTDANHEVRIAMGTEVGTTRNTIRIKEPNGNWIALDDAAWNDDYDIIHFTKNPNLIYVQGVSEYGTEGIYKLDYRSGEIVETVLEDPDVDVDTLLTDEYEGHAIGVGLTKDLYQTIYFDPEYKKVQKQVEAMLQGYSVIIADKARDKPKYLLAIDTPRNPVTYIIFDAKTNKMSMVANTREKIDPRLMSPKQRVNYKAADGMSIPAYLSLPLGVEPRNLPTVVLPHGGPAARTDGEFSMIAQHLVSRGYMVLEPNFRGSTGLGKSFRNQGKKQWGGLMQEDIADGAKWLIDQGLADPERICIAGISFGGYAAAFASIKDPGLYACGISINGVFDLPFFKETDRRSFINGAIWNKGMGLKGSPDEEISPEHRAAEVSMPMLIISAKNDERVPWQQSKNMHNTLKKLGKDSTYVSLKDGGHSMLTAQSRLTAMKAMETFLAKHIGK